MSKFRSHSDPNWRKRNTVEKEDDHMKHVMKKDNEEMRKRMDGHNHMTKHMMKKADAKAKVEPKVEPEEKPKVEAEEEQLEQVSIFPQL